MAIQAKEASGERLPLLIHVLHVPPTWYGLTRCVLCARPKAAPAFPGRGGGGRGEPWP
jgi:hypothetical protein